MMESYIWTVSMSLVGVTLSLALLVLTAAVVKVCLREEVAWVYRTVKEILYAKSGG